MIGEAKTPAVPSCPASPCLAVSRTTGFQVKVGTHPQPDEHPPRRLDRGVDGHARQAHGGADQVLQLQRGRRRRSRRSRCWPRRSKPNLTYKLIAQGPTVKLEKYFGQTAQFPLPTSIPVKKGELVALTVPTWAPALALDFGNDTSWRASRSKSAVHQHEHPDEPHPDRHRGAVLLPLPDRPPDLQRDADLHALRAAEPAPAGCRALRARRAGRTAGPLRRAGAAGGARGAVFFGAAGFAGAFFAAGGGSAARSRLRWRFTGGFRAAGALRIPSSRTLRRRIPRCVERLLAWSSWSSRSCRPAFSALVSLGGVISGVLLGGVSETFVPPQAASASAASSAPPGASQRRVLTAGPSAGRRWGSR